MDFVLSMVGTRGKAVAVLLPAVVLNKCSAKKEREIISADFYYNAPRDQNCMVQHSAQTFLATYLVQVFQHNLVSFRTTLAMI